MCFTLCLEVHILSFFFSRCKMYPVCCLVHMPAVTKFWQQLLLVSAFSEPKDFERGWAFCNFQNVDFGFNSH